MPKKKITTQINDVYAQIYAMSERMREQAGQKAMDFLSDYPLYAATDGITYEEAILIAIALGKEI